MKKILLLIALVVLLDGCSNEDVTPEEKENVSKDESVITQIIHEANEVKNVMVDFSIEQTVNLPELNDPLTVNQSDVTYIQSEPFRFLTEIDSPFGQFTIFNQGDQLYSFDAESGSHQKLDIKQLQPLNKLMKEQRHLTTVLNNLKAFEDQFKKSESDGQYTLTLEGKGDSFNQFVYNQLITSSIEGSNLPIKENEIKVNSVNIKLVVDQETMQVQELTTGFEMQRANEADTTIKQSIHRKYNEYNNNAKEIPEV